MKTERRHELQTNVLADSLAHWIEAAKPYSRAVLALLVALVVVIFTWGYLSAQTSRRNAEGWQHYFDALSGGDPRDKLSETIEQFGGTMAGEWSRLVLADIQLSDGTNRLFAEKKDGRDELREAVEKYRSVLSDSRDPMLLQRATFGLARAHEALGSLAEASKEYLSIAEKWPNSPYAATAKKRAADLELASTKGFYDWFAKYEPPRPLSGAPGTPGVRPDFLKDPLESGTKLPSAIDDTIALPKFGEPEATAPAADGDKPAESSPGGTTPNDSPAEKAETPSNDPPVEKPAEPK